MEKIDLYQVPLDISIRGALKQMDKTGLGMVVCVNQDGNVVGIATDGDFRRAILRGISLEREVSAIINRNFHFLEEDYDKQEALRLLKKIGGRPLPLLKNKKLLDVVKSQDLIETTDKMAAAESALNIPAVIMAGGKGTRLDPFTRVLPKPLIPIGERTIIEIIMDNFNQFGINEYYISINHKGKMIKAYFEDNAPNMSISYLEESIPLGTAGALKLLGDRVKGDFFVSNCDIIVRANYHSLYEFHRENNFSLTLIASMQHHVVPYGVCEIEEGGLLREIREKPEYDFLVNTGFYLLNADLLQYIPSDTRLDMPDLIKILQEKKISVGVYPVSQRSWIDIGQWSQYKQAIEKLI